MDVGEITAFLPHRYPMLMVDRIVEITDNSIVGLKNVTSNEPFFTGHFPGFPVMPGVLIIEAMAQVGGLLVGKLAPHTRGKIMFLASIEEAKFRKPVVPGDQLRLEMKSDATETYDCQDAGRRHSRWPGSRRSHSLVQADRSAGSRSNGGRLNRSPTALDGDPSFCNHPSPR